jgi:hypothetical protein
MEVEYDAEARERYKLDGKGSPSWDASVAPWKNAVPYSSMKIMGRVKHPIAREREYQRGENMEIVGKKEAWRLVEGGALGPPFDGSALGMASAGSSVG